MLESLASAGGTLASGPKSIAGRTKVLVRLGLRSRAKLPRGCLSKDAAKKWPQNQIRKRQSWTQRSTEDSAVASVAPKEICDAIKSQLATAIEVEVQQMKPWSNNSVGSGTLRGNSKGCGACWHQHSGGQGQGLLSP